MVDKKYTYDDMKSTLLTFEMNPELALIKTAVVDYVSRNKLRHMTLYTAADIAFISFLSTQVYEEMYPNIPIDSDDFDLDVILILKDFLDELTLLVEMF